MGNVCSCPDSLRLLMATSVQLIPSSMRHLAEFQNYINSTALGILVAFPVAFAAFGSNHLDIFRVCLRYDSAEVVFLQELTLAVFGYDME